MTPHWEHFAHEADMGVRGFGADPAQAFEQAALAMTAVITEPGDVRALESVSIRCEAPDLELLLAEWLNCLVYEMATRHMLFSRFEVRMRPGGLDARAWGERGEPTRHRPAVEVKGATYTALKVGRSEDG
ncbi:MAG: archease, partial [Betaproteobacteria bacterium]